MGLLTWVEDPRADRGLHFLEDSGEWSFRSYEALAASAFGVARQMEGVGLAKSDVVCVFLPTGPLLVSTLFGVWLAGGVICPLVPPMMFEDEAEYIAHVSRILLRARPRAIATDKTYCPLVHRIADQAGLGAEVVELDGAVVPATVPKGAGDLALLQFTSGSSGDPRGVCVSFENLESNIGSIRQWIRMGADDTTATWLPLYHDMGLIGCLLTPAVNASDVWIMRPDQFVRDPKSWIECFGKRGASLCAAPNFGYGYAARRVRGAAFLEDCDFSNWRVAIAGAEPVDAAALTDLARVLEPYGFSERAFLPAYGLAEATLAVTGGAPEEVARAAYIEWESLRFGELVRIGRVSELRDVALEESAGWLVGSGRPFRETAVGIVDEQGRSLEDGVLGEIVIRGPSVALGYNVEDASGPTRFSGEHLVTGDAGFVLDGELFVVGRMADSLKIRGRSVYADDLESRLVAATDIRRGRCVVVVLPSSSGMGLLVVGEQAPAGWKGQAESVLAGIVGQDVPTHFVTGDRGLIRRTSSGKPRRRLMWDLYQCGALGAGSEAPS